jgi:Ca2+-binding RTX toxin-like protein
LANTIVGNAGDNTLSGGDGKDKLTGGDGRDSFLFNTAPKAANVDTVFDFSTVDDRFLLSDAAFGGLGAAGPLAAGKFFIGGAAHDARGRIICDSARRALLYDPDGTGAAAATQFASLSSGLALTNTHFTVV